MPAPVTPETALLRAEKFAAAKKKSGLSEPEISILFDLTKQDGATYEGIATRTGTNPKTLKRYVLRLRSAGHIVRGNGEEDFKTVVVSLSPKGKKLVAGLLAHLA